MIKGKKLILFILVITSFLMGQIVHAQGDGSGDGAGGGQNEGLALVSSSINDGATGVSLKPDIKLTFSKNIVNMTVRDNNLKSFSLQNAKGNLIPIKVFMADDQVDFAARNDAVITPSANLVPGTVYSVVVSSALQSKSGVTTGQEIRLTFTTESSIKTTINKSKPAAATKAPAASVTNEKAVTNTQSKTPKNSIKVQKKPSAEQTAQVNQPKMTAGKTQTKSNTVTNENKTSASNAETIKSAEPKAVNKTGIKSGGVSPNSENKKESISALVITAIAVCAALAIYFYLRKKRRKL